MKKYFSSYWIRSAFYTFLQRFSLTFFGLINFMVLIRSLSKYEMGTWALFLAITSIFEASKGNLLKNATIKFVSGSKDDKEKSAIAASSLVINCLMSFLFILLMLFFSNWISVQLNTGIDLSVMFKWFIPGLVCMIFFSHLEAVQQSNFDFKGVFAGHLTRQLSFFIIIVIHAIFNIPFSLSHIALYLSISIVLGTLTLYVYSRKYLLYMSYATNFWIKKILNYGGYIFGSGLMSNIFANVDQIMTAKFMSSSSVAYYNAASRINGFVDIPSYAASEIIFPKLSRASVEEGSGKVKYLYERMVALLLSFTTPVAIFMILFPQFFIQVIAGSAYLAAAPILQLYLFAGIMRPMINQGANVFNSIGKPGLCFLINAISLAAYLPINYICLLQFGFYGAAIATLITTALGTIVWYFVMKKHVGFEFTNVINYIIDFYKSWYFSSKNFFSKTNNANL